jgi:hypothetical protein
MSCYKALLTVSLLFVIGIPAFAGPVNTDQWYEFEFAGIDTFATACTGCTPSSGGNSVYADDPPWTFTTANDRYLIVTDAFLHVDQFEVYDFNTSIGLTSAPSNSDLGGTTDNPALALLDAGYSKGFFSLGPGNHSITIEHIAGIPGAAYFQVSSVPEPSTLLLLSGGLAALAYLRRRK